jgi:hypothetical protein
MNQTLDWSKLEGKYWRPESDVQYVVEFTNWRLEEKTYGDSDTPRTVLTLDVLNVMKDSPGVPETQYFVPIKSFNCANQSFITGIRPVIEKAQMLKAQSVIVLLRKSGEGKKVMYSINDASVMHRFRK